METDVMTAKRKSVRLSEDERKSLKAFVRKQTAVVIAADMIGINRQVLDRVLLVWSGSPETIEKIRLAILK